MKLSFELIQYLFTSWVKGGPKQWLGLKGFKFCGLFPSVHYFWKTGKKFSKRHQSRLTVRWIILICLQISKDFSKAMWNYNFQHSK